MRSTAQSLEDLRSFMAVRRFVAARFELLGYGFSPSTIRSWLRQKRLVPVLHGVYSYGRDIETTQAAWRAALLAAGPDAVLASRSACEAWGIVRSREGIPFRIEVARPAGDPRTLHGLSPAMSHVSVQVATRDITTDEIRLKDGLPLTSPARTQIDYAGSATRTQLMFAFLEACRLDQFRRGDVDYCLRRMYGRRGARLLRPLLALWVPELRQTKSVLEGMFLLAWVATGGEVPLVNSRVGGYEVDFYWPLQRLIVETDGGAFHSDPIARRRDEIKTRELEALGNRVLRVSYGEMRDQPDRVIANVQAERARRR